MRKDKQAPQRGMEAKARRAAMGQARRSGGERRPEAGEAAEPPGTRQARDAERCGGAEPVRRPVLGGPGS